MPSQDYRLDDIVSRAQVRPTKKWRETMQEYYEETAKHIEQYKKTYVSIELGSDELCSIFNAKSLPVRVCDIYDVEAATIAWTVKLKPSAVISKNGINLRIIQKVYGEDELVAVREEDVVVFYPNGCTGDPRPISKTEAAVLGLVTCAHHGNLFPNNIGLSVDGEHYCRDAYHKIFTQCPVCSSHVKKIEAVQCSVSGDHCCAGCVSDWTQHIIEQRRHSFRRSYGAPQRSLLLGKIYKNRRLVGCEIEASRTRVSTTDKCAHDLPVEVGVSGDGSVLNGDEFITPPANGKDAERLVSGVCNTIKRQGWRVNESCGLHIHLNVEDFKSSPKLLSQLFATYYHLEETIQQWVLPERRSSRHARLLRQYYSPAMVQHLLDHPEDFTIFTYSPGDYQRSKEEKDELTDRLMKTRASRKYEDVRYRAFNFHAVYFHGTFEVRMHEGTLNDKTILHWMNLHAKIMNYAKNSFDLDQIKTIAAIEDVNRRIEAVAATIGLEKATLNFWKKKTRSERV